MKKLLLCIGLASCSLFSTKAQTVISGEITSDMTIGPGTYLLEGFVYVKSGATLTIEPGTIIRGDKDSKGTLIITRTGKINAQGTASDPIVFTSNVEAGSRAPGDWGGVIILGNAPINLKDTATSLPIDGVIEGGVDNAAGDGRYGGTDAADNSGIFSYVRIEFPGIAFQPNNEINGLTCGGVGNGTIIDHIQVSYSGDDSYEFFGGTVNAKNLVAYRGTDDDFDTDFGYSGKLQFLVSLRDAALSDLASGGASNGFESDNDASGSANLPLTSAIISNVTICGPMQTLSTDLTGQQFGVAARLRRNTSQSVFNSILMGFAKGLRIEGSAAQANAVADLLEFKTNFIAGMTQNYYASFDSAYILSATNDINTYTNNSDVMLTDPFNMTSPNWVPAVGSPALGAADFTHTKLASWFTPVTYVGAFGTTDWTDGWAEYDAQNKEYFAVGIKNVSVQGNIAAYPNPTTDMLNLDIHSAYSETVSIQLFDMNGRILMDQQVDIYGGGNLFSINTSELVSGLYMIQVKSAGNTETIKVTVK